MLAAGLLLAACLSKRSAALRHRVLAGTLLAAALVVPFSLALPEWTVTLPAVAREPGPPPTVLRSLETAASGAIASPSPGLDTASLVIAVWLTGVVLAAGALLAGLMRISRVAARAAPVEDRRWLEMLETLAARCRVPRRVVLSRTDSSSLLATWGALRPQVLLPRQAHDWTLDRVRVVLCHELAHIRRHDWLVQIGAETLRTVLWFNPLAWIVCARLRRESEQACDDDVLAMDVDARDYAAHLLALARQCRRPGAAWASAIPMAHPSTLERRITAMLNPRLDRRAPSPRVMALLAAALLLIAVPVASLRAGQAGPAPLTGTIYDVTGAVLPGVQVALVDADQNRWEAISNASGRFALPAVGPGTYVLEVNLVGFRALRHEFELSAARDWDRAVTLQVGELSEPVVIRGSRATAPQQVAPSSGRVAPVRVGGNIRAPMKVRDVRPVYPAAMREAGRTGVVPIEAIIGHDGTVSSVRVLSAQVHPDFAIAAVDAVRQWRFTPTLLNGVAVDVVMTVTIRFDLDN
jgi:TonB family protein